MIHQQNAKGSLWSATGTTIGGCGLISIVSVGSAALNQITIQDGTAIKFVHQCQITAQGQLNFVPPLAFTNLNTVVTGTPSYAVIFVPRP